MIRRNACKLGLALFAVVAVLWAESVAFAEPLVIVENGKVKPALAQSFTKVDDNTVRFVLKEPKAAIVKAQLEKALAGKAVVTVVDDKTIEVKGLPADNAFAEIAKVDIALTETAVATKEDPFASLGGSGAVALEVPDGSSALRARKKVKFEGIKDATGPVIKAKVAKVEKGAFPRVVLEVIVLRKPKECKAIHRGSRIKIVPEFVKLDVNDAQFQTNVGAFFLRRGDIVEVELGEAKEGVYKAIKVIRVK